MAFVGNLLGANKILGRYVTAAADTSKRATSAAPKGFLAVYIGESQKKRYVVPISYLSQPSFQALLNNFRTEDLAKPSNSYCSSYASQSI
uniref:Uncharacterized protein n=1 Tax=Brassica campestris TaxID=3711 RepID=M4ECT6_BRACM